MHNFGIQFHFWDHVWERSWQFFVLWKHWELRKDAGTSISRAILTAAIYSKVEKIPEECFWIWHSQHWCFSIWAIKFCLFKNNKFFCIGNFVCKILFFCSCETLKIQPDAWPFREISLVGLVGSSIQVHRRLFIIIILWCGSRKGFRKSTQMYWMRLFEEYSTTRRKKEYNSTCFSYLISNVFNFTVGTRSGA